MPVSRIAFIDIGTNTVRLVVGERNAGRPPRFLHQEVITTRLGEGLSRTGALGRAGIDRTVQALKGLLDKAGSFSVELIEAYATAWARAASNTDEMLSAAAGLNLPIWILTGEEEAAMSLEAAKLIPLDFSSAWVLDIGGGSSEIVAVGNGRAASIESVPLGAVSMTELFLSADPPISGLEPAIAEARKRFRGCNGKGIAQAVALGGTAAALGGLKVGLAPSDPGYFEKAQGLFLEAGWVSDTLMMLASMPLAARKAVRGMEQERADILVGGSALLHAFLRESEVAGVFLCLYSFIHGVAACRLANVDSVPEHKG